MLYSEVESRHTSKLEYVGRVVEVNNKDANEDDEADNNDLGSPVVDDRI